MILGAKKNKRRFEDLPPHLQRIGLRSMALFAFVGWTLLFGYGIYAWNDVRFVRESVEDTAEVIRVESVWSRDTNSTSSNLTYKPTFRFDTGNGKLHTVTPQYGSDEWRFSEGDSINIRYLPSEPEKALPDGYSPEWLGVTIYEWIILLIGGGFAVLGTLGYFDSRRWLSKKRDQITEDISAS